MMWKKSGSREELYYATVESFVTPYIMLQRCKTDNSSQDNLNKLA